MKVVGTSKTNKDANIFVHDKLRKKGKSHDKRYRNNGCRWSKLLFT